MFTLIFVDRETNQVTYAINEVRSIRYITLMNVGYVDRNRNICNARFKGSENLEIERIKIDNTVNELRVRIRNLRDKGNSETAIARMLGFESISELRVAYHSVRP